MAPWPPPRAAQPGAQPPHPTPNPQVNPAIIGGLLVDIGDQHIDLSLNTKIQEFEQLLADSV